MLDVEDYQPSKKNKYDEYVIERVVADEHMTEEIMEEDDEGEGERTAEEPQ